MINSYLLYQLSFRLLYFYFSFTLEFELTDNELEVASITVPSLGFLVTDLPLVTALGLSFGLIRPAGVITTASPGLISKLFENVVTFNLKEKYFCKLKLINHAITKIEVMPKKFLYSSATASTSAPSTCGDPK